jgi:phage anti-repressor protein
LLQANYPEAIKGQSRDIVAKAGRDYVRIAPQDSLRPSPHGAIDYYGTLSMGKELAMVENNDTGIKTSSENSIMGRCWPFASV